MFHKLIVSALLLSSFPIAADAQDWPAARTIKFIVPYAAGGSTDLAARLMADAVSKIVGQSIVVENMTGASGNIGTNAAAKSAPDGYTVLIAPDSVSSTAHIFKIDFDPLQDLIPVIQLTSQPVVLAVHPTLGARTVSELVALAKTRADLSYATSGVGSQQHMVGEWFAKLANIKIVHVAYRGGGQAINDLVAGHVQIGSLGSAPVLPFHTAGTLKILAQSTKKRSSALPEIPTYGEAGFPDIVLDQWLGAFLPSRTPAVIVQKLQASMDTSLADPTLRAKLAQSALDPIGGTSDQFAALVKEDFDKYARLVRDLGIKVSAQ